MAHTDSNFWKTGKQTRKNLMYSFDSELLVPNSPLSFPPKSTSLLDQQGKLFVHLVCSSNLIVFALPIEWKMTTRKGCGFLVKDGRNFFQINKLQQTRPRTRLVELENKFHYCSLFVMVINDESNPLKKYRKPFIFA